MPWMGGFICVLALLGTGGCAASREFAGRANPASTPYDTNAAARAVYLQHYKEAYRIAASGRTNITYAYRGDFARAAISGQRMGLQVGYGTLLETSLARWRKNAIRRGLILPKTTPFDSEPEARAVYLRSYRKNYREAAAGRSSITCFPQSLLTEAYCAGEHAGQRQARDEMMALELRCLDVYGQLEASLIRQHPDPFPQRSAGAGGSLIRGFFRVLGW